MPIDIRSIAQDDQQSKGNSSSWNTDWTTVPHHLLANILFQEPKRYRYQTTDGESNRGKSKATRRSWMEEGK